MGAGGEFELLHVIRVQSDDGVVIIGDFFLSRIESFFPFGSEEDCPPWFIMSVEYDKVIDVVGPIV